jgi:hypothetical protein
MFSMVRLAVLSICLALFGALGAFSVSAATLNGSVYGAKGISGLFAGGTVYDLTFIDTRGGSYFDTFQTTSANVGITGVNGIAQATEIMDAITAFKQPVGPFSTITGDTFLVMVYGSQGGDISFLTTGIGDVYRQNYGPFTEDARDFQFSNTSAFIRVSESINASPSAAISAVPVPASGIVLLTAVAAGAAVSSRRKRRLAS